jgi:NAD(P)-dependent dehydrogenase (short-subunit alcohol dehydrogenase family)
VTQRAIAEMARRYGGRVVNISALGRGRGLRRTRGAGRADQGRPSRGHPVTGHRVRLLRRPVSAVSPGVIWTPMHPPNSYQGLSARLPPLGRVGQVSDVVDASCSWSRRPASPARSAHRRRPDRRPLRPQARPAGRPARAGPARRAIRGGS